jgi:hypothetical protein
MDFAPRGAACRREGGFVIHGFGGQWPDDAIAGILHCEVRQAEEARNLQPPHPHILKTFEMQDIRYFFDT